MADASADPVNPTESAEQCWFCKAAPAVKEAAGHADLYNDVRLSDVQNTVTGYRITKKWNVLKVPVPRCRRCAAAHARRGNIQAGFTLIPVLAVIVAAICSWSRLDGFIGVFVVSLVGGLIVGLLGYGIGHLVGQMLTPGDVPSEKLRKDHPAVQALLAQGWKLGSKPQPGEEYKQP